MPPERGPAIQHCEVNKYRPLPKMPWNNKKNLNMQGCFFKNVRQELPECTQTDGEQEGEEDSMLFERRSR